MRTELGKILDAGRENRVFSAAAWSVGTADGALDRGVLGTRWHGGPDAAEDSRWDLASVTKPLVGLVIAALADRGLLTFEDPLARHLPAYAGGDKADITVRQLLTHTSGLPGGTPLYREHPTREALLEAIRTGPLRAAPGDRVEYSSQGFILLGLIAEAAGGHPLDELVAQFVSTPAGLTGTGFGPADAARAVATEDCPWRGHVVRGQVHDENAVVLGGICGHAGLFAPLPDVEHLGRVLAGGAAPLLKPATHAEMIRCQTEGLRRGLAWQCLDVPGSPVGTDLSPRAYGHTGFTGTSLWVEPDRGRYYVLLTNRVHPSRTTPGIETLRRAFHEAAVRL
ncbi:serine hydrolase domain-containing protein [Amycolatopsis saalfeldensis]|uniref:CubicO group peptidase, beta-lactamase class C family n=1 Tax=Amycolatopsis saalfeldensis TaxID=394193 RepID=A0A1H8PTN8_9PSEU|nr:serine hydrolase domain-containing protein [Amycolatopsis saalfeldensis]SEO45369.1 CubicO group peptidase, beta-lactamase class C family [Amycolatopsis saalfeldensis]